MSRRYVLPVLLAPAVWIGGCGLTVDLDPQPQGPEPEMDAGRDGGPDAGPDAGFDARSDDGAACVPAPEACDGADDDCDGRVDEAFDLSSDPDHCGACGNECPETGGTAGCSDGACVIECDTDRADCDEDPSTGCETDLGSPSSCGACGNECPSSLPVCLRKDGSFQCAPECVEPLVACDGECVDLGSNRNHCGACGDACFVDEHGIIGCIAGACVVMDCGDWHRDCNMDPSDGCERMLLTDSDCSACGDACEPDETCVSGSCTRS